MAIVSGRAAVSDSSEMLREQAGTALERGRSQRQRLQCFAADTAATTAARSCIVSGYDAWVRRIYIALKLARCPHSLAASLAVLPSMSLIPSSSIVLICGNHEPFNRLALNESVHNLRDVGDRDAPVKKVIGFD
jgi:hypothetical protein